MTPPPDVTVREAAAADHERVRAFYAGTAAGRTGLPDVDDRVLIAEQDGEVVGAVRLCVEEGVPVLRTMRVRPDAQRRGVGRALLRRFVSLLDGRACYCLPYGHLTGFYGEIGFQAVGSEALPPHLARRLAEYRAERPRENLIAMRRPAVAPAPAVRSERGVDAIVTRLRGQLDALPLLLGEATAEALRAKSPSGKWSTHDNLAHIARQHEVFLERVRRMVGEDAPALPQYRAEDDPAWPAWRALPTDEVRARLRALRVELLRVVERLSPADLARTGTHSRFGPLSLAAWLEFFLVHEAHHLYTILRRARGFD